MIEFFQVDLTIKEEQDDSVSIPARIRPTPRLRSSIDLRGDWWVITNGFWILHGQCEVGGRASWETNGVARIDSTTNPCYTVLVQTSRQVVTFPL